jgi:hypothetical protein
MKQSGSAILQTFLKLLLLAYIVALPGLPWLFPAQLDHVAVFAGMAVLGVALSAHRPALGVLFLLAAGVSAYVADRRIRAATGMGAFGGGIKGVSRPSSESSESVFGVAPPPVRPGVGVGVSGGVGVGVSGGVGGGGEDEVTEVEQSDEMNGRRDGDLDDDEGFVVYHNETGVVEGFSEESFQAEYSDAGHHVGPGGSASSDRPQLRSQFEGATVREVPLSYLSSPVLTPHEQSYVTAANLASAQDNRVSEESYSAIYAPIGGYSAQGVKSGDSVMGLE